jgi:hypothetical protein
VNLTTIDWLIMLLYFVFVLGIGFALKRFMKTSKDYLQAGRSLPAWICGLAFISANLGAQEVIGMGASGAKYGIVISQFYWIGAIPAMIFVGVFMMPFYYGSKARSVPEFLRLRFDEKTRAWNACTFAFMTVLSSGISMYAMARLIQTLHVFDSLFIHLGWPLQWIFHLSIILSAPHRALLHLSRRSHQRHLQRSPPVLPHRCRIPATGMGGPEERRRMERPQNLSSPGLYALLAGSGQRPHQSARRGLVLLSSPVSALCSPSATGARTSSSFRPPWRPTPRNPLVACLSSPRYPKCSSRFW